MRLILGMVLGCALTIGAAYVVDHRSSGPAMVRPMVNWEVVAQNWDRLAARARTEWERLAG
jgi:hypothetical protein